MRKGDIVAILPECLPELLSLGTNSIIQRYPLFKIECEEQYFTDHDFLCYALNSSLRVTSASLAFYIPSKMLTKVTESELRKIARAMDWFRMYRPLAIQTHPYTTVFK